MVRIFLICIGTASVAAGVIGLFVPVLPTTPFLLLAAACYARSSEHFHQWLLNNRWFGQYIKDYHEGRGIRRSQKVMALSLMWLSISLAVLFALEIWWAKALLTAIAVGVTIHLLRIPTRKRPQDSEKT